MASVTGYLPVPHNHACSAAVREAPLFHFIVEQRFLGLSPVLERPESLLLQTILIGCMNFRGLTLLLNLP